MTKAKKELPILSYKELGVRKYTYEYLIKTMGDLQRHSKAQPIDGCMVKFNMGTYISAQPQYSTKEAQVYTEKVLEKKKEKYGFSPYEDEIVPKHGCGTSACIAGWITLSAYADGKLKKLFPNVPIGRKDKTIEHLDSMASDLEEGQCPNLRKLFNSDLDASPKKAAQNIKKFLTGQMPKDGYVYGKDYEDVYPYG